MSDEPPDPRTTGKERVLCAVAVHYDNADEVVRYADHLLGLPVPEGWRVDVAVADNSRSWPSRIPLAEHFSVHVPDSNLGYLNGCGFALSSFVKQAGYWPDWIAVTNTDLTFETNSLWHLLESRWPHDVGAVAPRIRTQVHEDQNPFMFSRPRRERLELLRRVFGGMLWRRPLCLILGSGLYRVWSGWKSRKNRVGQPSGESTPIYAPHGSAVFLARTFFEAGGSLGMPWFMFGEEIHLAEQIRRSGLRVLWTPRIRVEHRMASSTGAMPVSRRLDWRAEALQHIIDLYFTEQAGITAR